MYGPILKSDADEALDRQKYSTNIIKGENPFMEGIIAKQFEMFQEQAQKVLGPKDEFLVD